MYLLKKILVSALAIGIIFISVPDLYADETSELLLKLLVKKGVITEKEANELRAEVSKIKEKEKVVVAEDVKEHLKKASWADRIKVKGDVRLRHEHRARVGTSYDSRFRIRARTALEAEITDTVKAAVGLASGSDDPRSTNQTLDDVFDTKNYGLDLAYIQWKPIKQAKLIGGKYEIPLYHPGDLIWDSDLRFEGASAHLNYSIKDDLGFDIPANLMLNTGFFVLDEISPDRKHPLLYAIQGGLGSSWGDILDWEGYVGYLDFVHIKGSTSPGTFGLSPNAGARATPAGYYYYDYNVLELSGDVTLHFLEQMAPKPLDVPLTLFGDYIQNLADGPKKHGYEIGVTLGKKPKAFGDWRARYNFRWLERNSFPEQFPDADAFQGRTDGYGHEALFSFGIAKNVWLEFDYYIFRDKNQGTLPNDKWGHIFQTDINVKF